MPNVTVRGDPLTELKRSGRTLIKTELQNRQRAVRPFDCIVRLTVGTDNKKPKKHQSCQTLDAVA